MGKGVICCDTTVVINFKQCKINPIILKVLQELLKDCEIVFVEFELQDEFTKRLVRNLANFYKIKLITLSDLQGKSFDKAWNITQKYSGLDDGERILLVYGLALKEKGINVCFLSDNDEAREAGRDLNLLPCCINGISIGGTIGIINALTNDKKELAKKIAEKIEKRGNWIPTDLAGKPPQPCKRNHC